MVLEIIDEAELKAVLNSSTLYPRKQIPQGIIKFMEHEGRCQDGYKDHRCHTRTGIRIFGIPYCITHAVLRADKIITSLSQQLIAQQLKPNYSFCCGDPGDCNAKCNGRNYE